MCVFLKYGSLHVVMVKIISEGLHSFSGWVSVNNWYQYLFYEKYGGLR